MLYLLNFKILPAKLVYKTETMITIYADRIYVRSGIKYFYIYFVFVVMTLVVHQITTLRSRQLQFKISFLVFIN